VTVSADEVSRIPAATPQPLDFSGRDRNRFIPPVGRPNTVPRTRLDRFYEGARGGVLRVLAPGGYGKSTLVAGWIACDDRRVAWIDLEPVDNDPTVFADALCRALDLDTSIVRPTYPSAALSKRDFVEKFGPAFGAAIAADGEPFVLVLDDVHELVDETSSALIDSVAENLGSSSTLALVGRAHRVDTAIGRLRLHPGVSDVMSDQLALDEVEADELLTSIGLDTSGDQRRAIIARFAGWPAGLNLAGLVISASSDSSLPALDDLGDARFIADYLRSEWTSSIADDDLALLSGAACLGRFTGEICDEILRRSGSAMALRRLQHDEQLVLSLDQRDNWYRMHPVLARWLESEYRRADPDGWRRVHLDASQWWEQAGDIDLAFSHATSVGDHDRQEQLIVDHAQMQFTMGRYETIQRWLESLPEQRVNTSIALCALATMQAIQSGDSDRVHLWRTRMNRCVEAEHHESAGAELHAQVLEALLGTQSSAELATMASTAAEELPAGAWQVTGLYTAGCHRFMADVDVDGAVAQLRRATESAILDAGPQLQAITLAVETTVRDFLGDRTGTADAAHRAADLVAMVRPDFVPPTTPVTAINALAAARSGDDHNARNWLAICRQQLQGYHSIAPWYNVFNRLPLIRAAIALRDRRLALDLFQEASTWLARCGDAPGVVRVLAELEADVHRLPSGSEHVEQLTPAEARVLAYLPTHLSLADIAQRLFVSRNTVKSHTLAVYRKFGVTSRSEAVATAQAAGLIGEHDLVLED